ncbi:MAG: hypothetical protein QOI41_6720 [Myxococcales bacterium]|nr:hypothetical protein [Myxococcales bacterium]
MTTTEAAQRKRVDDVVLRSEGVKRPLLATFLGAASTFAVACSLLVDTADLTSTESPRDAATDGAKSANDDATSANDATTDAAISATDARFCAALADAGAAFCDDFDDPGRTQLGTAGWGQIASYPMGQITSEHAASPPHSVRFVFGDGDGGTGRAGAEMTVPFGPTKNEIVLHASLYPGVGYRGPVLALNFTSCSTVVYADGNVNAYCPTFMTGPAGAALAAGRWTNVALSVARLGDGSIRLTLTVGDGLDAVAATRDVPGPTGGLGSDVGVALGESVDDVSGSVEIDNVYVEVK